jgi:psp operon transcriptional activator
MVKELGRDYFPGFSKAAAKALLEYRWPGNVRELKNVVERCVYQCEDPDQQVKDVVFDPFASPWRPLASTRAATPVQGARGESDIEVKLAAGGFKQQVQDYEIRLLREALAQAQFNQRRAAKLLDLTYDQLRGYLRKYELLGKGE